MNAPTPAGNGTGRDLKPIDQVRVALGKMSGELKMALPSHIKPEKFQRVVMTVLQQTPDLLAADRRTLFGACMKCASDGLIPDGREAALVIFKTKRPDGSYQPAVQYMPMLQGILKRARNSGDLASVSAQVVYANDEFSYTLGDDEGIKHVPRLDGDRGKPVAAYAIAKLKDGSIQREVMTIDQIESVRSVSRSKDKGPWKDWWDEMARKTVFRRLSKWLPMDTEDQDYLERVAGRDDEEPATIEGEFSTQAPERYGRLDALEDGIGDQGEDPAPEPASDGMRAGAIDVGDDGSPAHDPETGELRDDVGSTDATTEPPAWAKRAAEIEHAILDAQSLTTLAKLMAEAKPHLDAMPEAERDRLQGVHERREHDLRAGAKEKGGDLLEEGK